MAQSSNFHILSQIQHFLRHFQCSCSDTRTVSFFLLFPPTLTVRSEGTRANGRGAEGMCLGLFALSPFCATPPPGDESKLWRCLWIHHLRGSERGCSTFMLNLLVPGPASDFRDNWSCLAHSTGEIRSHSNGNWTFCGC